jgi:hypothetical protein
MPDKRSGFFERVGMSDGREALSILARFFLKQCGRVLSIGRSRCVGDFPFIVFDFDAEERALGVDQKVTF